MDENQHTTKILPMKVLQKVYCYLQIVYDKNAWQFVYRKWYIAVIDGPKIRLEIVYLSLMDQLYDNLKRYPTFGSKIFSIKDMSSDNVPVPDNVDDDKIKMKFEFILKSCPFIYKLLPDCDNLFCIYQYLKALNPPNIQVPYLEELQLENIDTYDAPNYYIEMSKLYFQVCHKSKKYIVNLEISFLAPDESAEVFLEEQYGGMINYISSFPNLSSLEVEFPTDFAAVPQKFDMISLVAPQTKLTDLVIDGYAHDFSLADDFIYLDLCSNNKIKELHLRAGRISTSTLISIMTEFLRIENISIRASAKESLGALFAEFKAYCPSGKSRSVYVDIKETPLHFTFPQR